MIPLNALTEDLDSDLRKGEQYWIRTKTTTVSALFTHVNAMGQYVFDVDVDSTGANPLLKNVKTNPATWKAMRSDGRAVRIAKAFVNDKGLMEIGDFNPINLLDPEEPKITVAEREARLRKFRTFQRRRALRFYVVKADELPHLSKGHVGVKNFIRSVAGEARRAGHVYQPSPGTLLRALKDCGSYNSRPMSAFFHDYDAYRKLKSWHPLVIELCDKFIDEYWKDAKVRLTDTRARAFNAINAEIALLKAKHLAIPPNLKLPAKETFRKWLALTEDWYRWKSRYGEDAANRRYKGHGVSVKATRPGEYVLFDHTIIDEWAIIEDENGDVILTERPTLTIAVDLYSHMVLGAVLSYEKPSLYNVMACLQQVVRYKELLVERYGHLKGATDGYIKPLSVVVDNGWEFWGVSFQSTLEANGINVIWAPVRTPEFKAVVERLFGLINENVWHLLEGGLPFTPQIRSKMRINPQTEAMYNMVDLEARLWHYIVTVLHLHVNDALGGCPAQLWTRGLKARGRQTVDSVESFDAYLGQTTRARLTPEGIKVWDQHYHDPAITTELLIRILPGSSPTRKSGDQLGRQSVEVNVTRDIMNVSRLHVWDPILKTHIVLPHISVKTPMSWSILKVVEEYAERKNLAFHSEEEQLKARSEYLDIVRGLVDIEPFREARKHAKLLEPSPVLVPGDRVEQVHVQPNENGTVDIPHDTAIKHRTDDLVSEIGPSKSKGRKKPASTSRAARKPKPETQPVASVPAPSSVAPGPAPVAQVDAQDDGDDFLAKLLARRSANVEA